MKIHSFIQRQRLIKFWFVFHGERESESEGESSMDFVACDVLCSDTKSIIFLPHATMKQLFNVYIVLNSDVLIRIHDLLRPNEIDFNLTLSLQACVK